VADVAQALNGLPAMAEAELLLREVLSSERMREPQSKPSIPSPDRERG
jgi:hypothetical protein